jgi:uncharacterized membrane protein YsdA (DUF1294 family)/cold shock CspA family protein
VVQPGLYRGKLTKWNDERGFGFIQPVNSHQEVFLHISEIQASTRRPQVDDTIYYYAVANENGQLRAYNAFILGARKKPTSASRSFTDKATGPFFLQQILLLSILPLVSLIHFVERTHNSLPLIVYPVMNILTYALYAVDKSRAKRGDWRIPEQNLHLCELTGGWLGGFVAQRRLNHKSTKKSYQFEFWMIFIIHQIGCLSYLFLVK